MRGRPAILKANRQRGISRMGRNDCLLKGGVRIALDRRKETRPSIAPGYEPYSGGSAELMA